MSELNFEQLEQAELAIDVTFVGIVYCENRCFDGKQISISKYVVKIIPSRDAWFKLFDSTSIDCKI